MENQGTCNETVLRVQEIPPAATIETTGKILNLTSPASIYELLRSGKLRSIVIGGKRLISGESIVALLRESEQKTYERIHQSPRKKQKSLTGSSE